MKNGAEKQRKEDHRSQDHWKKRGERRGERWRDGGTGRRGEVGRWGVGSEEVEGGERQLDGRCKARYDVGSG